MSPPIVPETLDALADLLEGGATPRAALATLEQVGGRSRVWAREVSHIVASGVSLGAALGQTRSISVFEAKAVGGPSYVGHPSTLRYVAERRRMLERRRKTAFRALIMPFIWALMTVGSSRTLMASLGTTDHSTWVDLFPLAVVVLIVWSASRFGWPIHFAQIPPFTKIGRNHERAELAAALSAGIADGQSVTKVLQRATAFLGSTPLAKHLKKNATNVPQAMSAEIVGEPLALTLATGAGRADLPQRLLTYATASRASVTFGLKWIVRIVAWIAISWIAWRVLELLLSVGVGGLGGFDMSGEGSGELNELLREINLP